jgi:hypothetical protein
MPHFNRTMSVTQGFNFSKDRQDNVAFLTALKIGDYEFKADLTTMKDPETPSDTLDGVVAVLSSFSWDASTVGSIYMSGQLSTENRKMLAELLLGDKTSMEVTFKYDIYVFDPADKVYFKSSFTDADLEGLIEKSGSDLNIDVADDPSHEVQSPQNYTFSIGIKPKSLEQEIHLAVGVQKNITKKWGITEAA